MGDTSPGSRVGDYVLDAELPARAGEQLFSSTHRLLPRRAHIVLPDPARAFELARLLEELRHPAVPRIYECGELDGARPWLAVAVVDGDTLARRIAAAPLAPHVAVALIRDVAEVLAHAHHRGVVHGGIRTDAIVATPDGWRVVDWSDADVADDPVTDVEALGAVAYAALARCLPTMPLVRRCPGVPAGVAELIDRLLGAPAAATAVHEEAVRLFERLVQDLERLPIEDDGVPIAIEDLELVEISRPPPIPATIRVRAQGSGPVPIAKLALKRKGSES